MGTPRSPHGVDGRAGVPRVKTAVPRLSPRHQHRPRLLARLDGAGSDEVVLVSAPAGFGKSQLLAEWALAGRDRTAWVALDEDDNDDHRFWAAVLQALGSCLGPANPVHRMAVPAVPSRDPEFLAEVAGVVDTLPVPLRLVLDDVHELVSPDPLHGLGVLVRDRSPWLRLVLSGRTDPPLPVARLRLGGELCEMRAADLRFSLAEAETVLAAEGVDLTPVQVRRLVEQTEGWPAGLRLAAISLRDGGAPERFLADLAGNGRAVSDYLVGEVLSGLPPDTLDLLHAVSICDRLPAPLAVALSGRPDAGEVLDGLERATALVISSGDGRAWYRVHPLLRAHLRADLQRTRPDLVVTLHGRAATWFAAHRRPVHALTHARLGGSVGQVGELLRRHAIALVADGERAALRAALTWLGDQDAGHDPWFALVAALVATESGRHDDADTHLAGAASVWPADAGTDLQELRRAVTARRATLLGDPAAHDGAVGTPGAPPTGDGEVEAIAQLDRALVLAIGGRTGEARALGEVALRRARRRQHGYLAARALAVLGAAAAGEGDYGSMVALAEQADAELPGAEWLSSAAAELTSTLRAYGALLVAEPARCVDLLVPLPDRAAASPVPALDPVRSALLGAALCDLGRVDDGLVRLAGARAAAVVRPGPPTMTATIAALEHGTATAAGRPDQARAALAWAQDALGADAPDLAIALARRHLALGRPEAAADALRPVLEGRRPVLVPWTVAEAQVLRCLLALRAGRRQQARRDLDRALGLAGLTSALRPLALGPPEVIDLLTRDLGGYGSAEDVACRVLEARHAATPYGGPTRLTDRERDVLSLLPTQRSLEEIAAELAVSHSTVKTHVKSIYTKLDAGSRREAVLAARRRGLISAGPPAP